MAGSLAALFADTAGRYGLPADYLGRTAQIESGLNPAARNPRSSAGGLFQFIDSTAGRYGLTDRFDPTQATDAAARLARDNAAVLRQVLGRDPNGGELYLAHQQGAGGAAKLLANPDVPAASLVGARAVSLNGGSPNMSAADFAGKWLAKYSGGQTMQPGTALPMMAQAGAPQPVTPGIQMAPNAPGASPLAAMFAMQALEGEQQKRRQAEQEAEQARRNALFGGPSPFG